MKKKEIGFYNYSLDVETIFDGKNPDNIQESLGRAVSYAKDFVNQKYGHEITKMLFSTDYVGYDGGEQLYIIFYREETDQEYQKRLDEEQKVKGRQDELKCKKEEKERKEYERLKKKFG